MRFRPCIDLHDGIVKQIVGSSLDDSSPGSLKTNFSAEKPSSWFAELYKKDNLTGGHIIKLGAGNDDAALAALQAWPGGMQIGGGVNSENASYWLDAGASHVIVTSFVFSKGKIAVDRLQELVNKVGKNRLVLDLSCRKKDGRYYIVTDRWQKFTDVAVNEESLVWFSSYCDEFLIHAADVEGKCQGIELELVEMLGRCSPIATTYAGGVRNLNDLQLINQHGDGKMDATIGSALDIFGGKSVRYEEAVAFNNSNKD
jgi:phosphoribosylformimino-5-aminoimidazole carboxamide ribotide isomerase